MIIRRRYLCLGKINRKTVYIEFKIIVDYMHEERAYLETEPGGIIPFSLAKEIRKF